MEMLVIFVVALLVLGPSKLPEAGRQVGRALAQFRNWSSGVQTELRTALEVDVEPHDPAPPSLEPLNLPDSSPRPPSTFPEQQSFT